MNRIILQITGLIAAFFALYLGLSQVNWVKILKVKEATQSTEEKLGDLFWDLFSKENSEIKGKYAKAPLDSILEKLCTANKIDKSSIKFHIVKSDQINAFALPNRHLVVNSALILASENEGELIGVIGHELAHIEMNHVMKKLVKEIGLSVLISMTTGGGGETVKEAAKLLSSSAYDRTLEQEADDKSVEYLLNSNVNPEPFADFLYRLGDEEPSSMKYFSWVSTHPDSKERAKRVIEFLANKNEKSFEKILSTKTWDKLKDYLKEE